ncbi:membrane-spanning 4-domains subfamily A member 6D-like [Cavia porcellus]|nr:membrane-spanning 4-domains subfamily A member 6D-like isoform X2 [Cavia porcellus]XP_013003855.1 membrane-spanning 4-domains subfamily A member 6D-like isoform X2 [Cavia porcellus]XP_013003856.1 membrane-spanning 4-domains subfamily A member 6D-like isoform X2 [Cavia porcellus]
MSHPITNETIAVLEGHGIHLHLPQTKKPPTTVPAQESLKKRLQAESNVFGVIQILCGVMVLSLGVILAAAPASPYFTAHFSLLIDSACPFLGALCFIVSGSLSVVIEKKRTKSLVCSSLACSFLSTIFALGGITLLSYTLDALESAFQHCELSRTSQPNTTDYSYYYQDKYSSGCLSAKISLMGTMLLMLICMTLELCLAVLMAVLWWKQTLSNFSGTVLFQPQTYKNNSSIIPKTHVNPGYEELVTP